MQTTTEYKIQVVEHKGIKWERYDYGFNYSSCWVNRDTREVCNTDTEKFRELENEYIKLVRAGNEN